VAEVVAIGCWGAGVVAAVMAWTLLLLILFVEVKEDSDSIVLDLYQKKIMSFLTETLSVQNGGKTETTFSC
jgi:hypothetical protein